MLRTTGLELFSRVLWHKSLSLKPNRISTKFEFIGMLVLMAVYPLTAKTLGVVNIKVGCV